MTSAYAVYFDYKRRTDLEFRRAIKRERRREARIAKTQAEEAGSQQLRAIKAAVIEAQDEGFPTDGEERETYFMTEVGNGEKMCQEGMRAPVKFPEDQNPAFASRATISFC
jgi:import receptor subunit TOM20